MKKPSHTGRRRRIVGAMPHPLRRLRFWLVAVALVATALVAEAVAFVVQGGSRHIVGGGGNSATIVARGGTSATPVPLTSLSVFKDRRTSTDALPAPLRHVARDLSTTSNGGIGNADLAASRLLTGASRRSIFAWPIGASGVCIGVIDATARCLRILSAASPLGPSLLYGRSKTVDAAGLVFDAVKTVTVRAGQAGCRAIVVRNGFICSLPVAKVPFHATALLTLRSGATKTVTFP